MHEPMNIYESTCEKRGGRYSGESGKLLLRTPQLPASSTSPVEETHEYNVNEMEARIWKKMKLEPLLMFLEITTPEFASCNPITANENAALL